MSEAADRKAMAVLAAPMITAPMAYADRRRLLAAALDEFAASEVKRVLGEVREEIEKFGTAQGGRATPILASEALAIIDNTIRTGGDR